MRNAFYNLRKASLGLSILLACAAAHAGNLNRNIECVPTSGSSCATRIPDFNTADGVGTLNFSMPANVCSGAAILSYGMQVNIQHEDIGDLIVSAISPSSTTVQLVNRLANGTSGTGSCAGDDIVATFQDSATTGQSCGTTIPAISGTVTGVQALSGFGTNLQSGTWSLEARNKVHGSNGQISDAVLIVECAITDDIFIDGFGTP